MGTQLVGRILFLTNPLREARQEKYSSGEWFQNTVMLFKPCRPNCLDGLCPNLMTIVLVLDFCITTLLPCKLVAGGTQEPSIAPAPAPLISGK
jgi:hypothetical protein